MGFCLKLEELVGRQTRKALRLLPIPGRLPQHSITVFFWKGPFGFHGGCVCTWASVTGMHPFVDTHSSSSSVGILQIMAVCVCVFYHLIL